MSLNIPTKKLPSGAEIPVIGLGVYKAEPGAENYNAVLSALKLGYRHIATAQFYKNEADVGRAMRDAGVPRGEIFVTNKLFTSNWGYDKAMAASKTSNEELGLGYIDLYLLHTPGPAATRDETWRALEDLQQQGIVKDIGVSNFGEAHLGKFFKSARVKPAVNQLELHPWLMRPSLVDYCRVHDILLQAYSPLAGARKLEDPTILEIANEAGATAAQVLVAFSLANLERQKANLDAASILLTARQVSKLVALNEGLVVSWNSQDPIELCTVWSIVNFRVGIAILRNLTRLINRFPS